MSIKMEMISSIIDRDLDITITPDELGSIAWIRVNGVWDIGIQISDEGIIVNTWDAKHYTAEPLASHYVFDNERN